MLEDGEQMLRPLPISTPLYIKRTLDAGPDLSSLWTRFHNTFVRGGINRVTAPDQQIITLLRPPRQEASTNTRRLGWKGTSNIREILPRPRRMILSLLSSRSIATGSSSSSFTLIVCKQALPKMPGEATSGRVFAILKLL